MTWYNISMEENELKTIPGFPNYSITKDGRVWSIPRKDRHGGHRKGKWLKSCTAGGGYNYVKLDTTITKRVNRLVLETFIGPCPDGMECRHLNGIRTDN